MSQIQQFVDGNLQISIKNGIFTPKNPLFPTIFASCSICAENDGRYAFECSKVSASRPFDVEMFKLRGRIQLGMFLSDDDVYRFAGEDEFGNTWACDKIYVPILYNTVAVGLPNFTSKTSELRCGDEETINDENDIILIELRADGNKKFLAHPKFELKLAPSEVGEFLLSISARTGWYQICAEGSGNLPIWLEWKIVEALEVACDYTFRIAQTIRVSKGKICCQMYSTQMRSIINQAPIIPISENEKFHPDLKCFFNKYVEMSRNYDRKSHTRLHPCTYFLRMLRNETSYSIDAEISVASIVCEGLVSMVEKKVPIDRDLEVSLRKIESEILKLDLDNNVSKRILGALSGMKSTGPAGKFSYLVQQSLVRDIDFLTWKKLRNKYAHLTPDTFITEYNVRERYMDLLKLKNLALSVVFFIVGYEGHFVNHTVPNFPICKYPFID